MIKSLFHEVKPGLGMPYLYSAALTHHRQGGDLVLIIQLTNIEDHEPGRQGRHYEAMQGVCPLLFQLHFQGVREAIQRWHQTVGSSECGKKHQHDAA